MVNTDAFQNELLNLAKNRNFSNKQRRFNAYKIAAGIAGFNYRQKLPGCVEQYIKERFYEETGDYTGFQKK